MTEAEAKTHWCPFARQLDWDDNQAAGAPVSANRHFDGSPSTRCLCIGSACMAWRLDETTSEISDVEKPESEGWKMYLYGGHGVPRWSRKINPEDRRGYCGLAGRP